MIEPWPLVLSVLGWVVFALIILFAILVVWSFIAVAVKRARRSRTHQIFKSPGK